MNKFLLNKVIKNVKLEEEEEAPVGSCKFKWTTTENGYKNSEEKQQQLCLFVNKSKGIFYDTQWCIRCFSFDWIFSSLLEI